MKNKQLIAFCLFLTIPIKTSDMETSKQQLHAELKHLATFFDYSEKTKKRYSLLWCTLNETFFNLYKNQTELSSPTETESLSQQLKLQVKALFNARDRQWQHKPRKWTDEIRMAPRRNALLLVETLEQISDKKHAKNKHI